MIAILRMIFSELGSSLWTLVIRVFVRRGRMTLGCMAERQAVRGLKGSKCYGSLKSQSTSIIWKCILIENTLSDCGFKSLYVTVLRKLLTLVFSFSYTLKSVSLPVQISSLSFWLRGKNKIHFASSRICQHLLNWVKGLNCEACLFVGLKDLNRLGVKLSELNS